MRSPRCTHRIFVLTSLLAVGACQDTPESPLGPQLGLSDAVSARTSAFTVYSQNVYLGGDTGPLFSLDFSDLGAVLAATGTFWAQVQASAATERADAIVDQIDASRPHIVSLQEALRFVLLDGVGQPIGGLDFLALIDGGLQARGLPYTVEVVQEGTSSTLPLAFDPTVGVTRWLNFTDRVVVIRRNDITATGTDQGLYAARLPLGPLDLVRGWARISLDFEGTPHHVIATHLETQAILPVHVAQADELENVVASGLDGVTIIAGDLNSDASASEGDRSWTPTYGNLLDAGFVDTWARAPHSTNDAGYTCCYDPALTGSEALDERIDFVLARAALDDGAAADEGLHRGHFRSTIVGTRPGDLTPSGLRLSDHAGLVSSLRMPGRRR